MDNKFLAFIFQHSDMGFKRLSTRDEDSLVVNESLLYPEKVRLSDDDFSMGAAPRPALYHNIRRYTIFNVLIFLCTLGLAVSMITADLSTLRDGNYHLKKVSEHSPIFEQFDIEMRTKQMEATLLRPSSGSIFRQPPSRAVDDAWDRIVNVKPIPITREDVVKLGKDPDSSAKFPESFGFGEDAYIGRLDIFHVIHCVDQVRREAYFDHYYGNHWGTRANASELHKMHIEHCIHIILQNVMCSPNLDVYTHFWADAELNAFPDFSVNHKCFDFERLLDWQETNSVDLDAFGAIRRPEGVQPRVMTPEFKELFGYNGPDEENGSAIA